MSTLETNLVQPSTGTTLTVGASNDTVDLRTIRRNNLYCNWRNSYNWWINTEGIKNFTKFLVQNISDATQHITIDSALSHDIGLTVCIT